MASSHDDTTIEEPSEQSKEVGGELNSTLEEGMANLVFNDSKGGFTKSMVDVVREMVKETKLRDAKDILSVLKFYSQTEKNEDDPEWYTGNAMIMAAAPSRLARLDFTKDLIKRHKQWISTDWKDGAFKVLDYGCGPGLASQALFPYVSKVVGIDEDPNMVNIYNEIAKRQGHPKLAMRAYTGNLLPGYPTGPAPGLADNSALEDHNKFENFDLLVIDCFEVLGLNRGKRIRQLVGSLRAFTNLLADDGTILIMDIQKVTTQTGPAVFGLVDGHKTTGYDSDVIVKALQLLNMVDIDVIDNLRFQWEATADEKKLWIPNKANDVFFMIKAKKVSFKNDALGIK
ncbi:MAG: hypothetical protein Q9209_005921 [Squamulea sp. 1 TL-2023]